MEETIKDSLIVIGRVVTILPLLLFMTIYMGKRTIGEIPVFDFLIIISLGSIVGADLADPSISHIYTAVAIVSVALLQRVITKLKLANRRFGRIVTFEPTVVIQNGQFLKENMKNIGYSIDNVLQLLREKDVFDIDEVKTAIVESSGKVSVLKKSSSTNVTRSDLNITGKAADIALPIVVEGKVYTHVLEDFGLDYDWLQKRMKEQEVQNVNEIFYATINQKQKLHISLKENNLNVPRILH
ncbi:DUF421 domain-containing protein [Alkalibacillus haloalkaliphilus]|uniref:DUF421 domain-containing protein n=1 Tax=Alkalibacillus haloalkaliphilus TaxID=94136 RepID=UPI00031C6845|nr:DUF421 domain-containing protein [Alkalibacillus haloalkaliphilus]